MDSARSYVPAPKTLPGFPKATGTRPKTPMGGGKKRKRWINDDGDILEWDYQHGKVERYSPKGKHRGEFDPNTGKQTKPADPRRTITPTIWKKRKSMVIGFELEWFNRTDDEFVGAADLPQTTEDEVRKAFGLADGEYPGDCLEVTEKHVDWLKTKIDVPVQLDKYEYFVAIFAQ